MIRVFLADDQELVRQGLRALLQISGEVEIVGEASDGQEAVAGVNGVELDVLLLDVRMPKLSGPEVLDALALRGPVPKTILLTTFDDDQALIAGIRAGAHGFLLKGIDFDELMACLRVVAAGGVCGFNGNNDRLRRALAAPSRTEEPTSEPLTAREQDVLRLMAAGLSNRDIGKALRISEGTTKNYASVVMAKLGVTDRTKAVLRAMRDGLI